MKFYVKPEIELVEFTSEMITDDGDPDIGTGSGEVDEW